MLTVKDLNFSYGTDSILSNINFQMDQGKLIAVLGENGAGKTTLFKLILGLIKAEKGQIQIQGDDIISLSAEELARRVAYVPQESNLSFNHYVIDIVEMGGIDLSEEEALERAYGILEQLGMTHLALKGYLEISGGQRQLVRIAQALMQDSPIILMDEPTNNLDYGNQLKILSFCRDLVADKRTIIMTSHQPQDVLNFCDEALLLSKQQVLAFDKVEKIIDKNAIAELYDVKVTLDQSKPDYPAQILPDVVKKNKI